MQLEIGKKYAVGYAEVEFVQITGILFDGDGVVYANVHYMDGIVTVADCWASNGLTFDRSVADLWDLQECAAFDDLWRSCSLGCSLIDTGMKWSYCSRCEQPYEFKNWEWVAMRKAQ